ncbi:hypothetical protein CCL08_01590, partial [Pseudomonas congelans]
QRGNAFRDAPRHNFAPRWICRIGRKASRTAYPRGAWARQGARPDDASPVREGAAASHKQINIGKNYE